MIISHEHKYVFLELPFTATRAISQELRTHYGGEQVLLKHSNYPEFARYANARERGYFVFCGLRNPLQIPVSLYLKYRNTPVDRLWLGKAEKKHNRNPVTVVHDFVSRRKVAFAQKEETSFDDYFLRYFHAPYDDWSRVTLPYCDAVVRFERLQEDFAAVLETLGLQAVRELPKRGNAVSWSHDPASYYGPRSVARAKRVFGPYMQRWGYHFPPSWTAGDPTATSLLLDKALAVPRVAWWRWVRGLLDIDLHKQARAWAHAATLPEGTSKTGP